MLANKLKVYDKHELCKLKTRILESITRKFEYSKSNKKVEYPGTRYLEMESLRRRCITR